MLLYNVAYNTAFLHLLLTREANYIVSVSIKLMTMLSEKQFKFKRKLNVFDDSCPVNVHENDQSMV